MVIGNRSEIAANLLKPGNTMASVIANEFAEATTPLHQSALIEIALMLFVITLIINMFARAAGLARRAVALQARGEGLAVAGLMPGRRAPWHWQIERGAAYSGGA